MTRNILSKSGILLFLAVDLMLIVAWLGVQRGMILYGIFLLTAVSPLGEQIMRLYYGCSPLSRTDQIVKIEPIYHEVLDKARQLNRHLPPDIRVYISNEDRSDIYSLGRDTLVTTEAALARPDAELKAMMAHELGHIVNHDSMWTMMATVGNVFVTLFLLLIKLIVQAMDLIVHAIRPYGFTARLIVSIFQALTMGLRTMLNAVSDIWNKFMQLLVNWSLREDEFFADLFAYDLGYGYALCRVIEENTGNAAQGAGLILSPQQDPQLRIRRLQEAGCNYRKTY